MILFSTEMERLLFGMFCLPLLACYHALPTRKLPFGSTQEGVRDTYRVHLPRAVPIPMTIDSSGSSFSGARSNVAKALKTNISYSSKDDQTQENELFSNDYVYQLLPRFLIKTSPENLEIHAKDTKSSGLEKKMSSSLKDSGVLATAITKETEPSTQVLQNSAASGKNSEDAIAHEKEGIGFSSHKECTGLCLVTSSNLVSSTTSKIPLRSQRVLNYVKKGILLRPEVDGNDRKETVRRMRRAVYFLGSSLNRWSNRRNEKLGLEISDVYPVKMIKFVRELVETAPWDKLFMSMVRLVVDNFIDKILEKMFSKGRSSSDFRDLFPELPITQVVRMKRSVGNNQLWHLEDLSIPSSPRKKRQQCSLRNVCNAGRLLSRLPSIHELAMQLRSPGEESYWNALLWGMEKKRCSRILCKRTRAPKGSKYP